MTAAYHHRFEGRAMAIPAMLSTRAVWVCDPKRTQSPAPRSDTKWEVDSKAEGAGS